MVSGEPSSGKDISLIRNQEGHEQIYSGLQNKETVANFRIFKLDNLVKCR